jgi:RNA polymerase sigma factor (sigma-70 family)
MTAFEISNYNDGLSDFMSVRHRLFGIAYRMLGSTTEAEDLVQEVWLRWQTANRRLVRDPAAFLATTTTRLAINVMRSARSRHERAVDSWLQEPIDTSADPWSGPERRQALASGVLLLLQELTPTERTAFILREAFDYAYRDIANVLRLNEANARQIVTRARQHLASGRTITRDNATRGPVMTRRRPASFRQWTIPRAVGASHVYGSVSSSPNHALRSGSHLR